MGRDRRRSKERARTPPAAAQATGETSAELPDELVRRLAELGVDPDLVGRPVPLAVRANALVASPDEVARELADAGLGPRRVPWSEHALVLEGSGDGPAPTARDVQATDAHRRGALFVQGLASQTAALVLDPRPGDHVLDLCAAPGGKTAQIAALTGGRARIVANDRSRDRSYKLGSVLAHQQVAGVELRRSDGMALARSLARRGELFDRVLVDAPCSAEARLRLDRPETLREWRPSKVKRLAGEQRGLLLAAAGCLRPGGVLVYATCTFAPEENEAVVARLLHRLGDEIEPEDVELDVASRAPGLVEWRGKRFDTRLARCARLLPDGLWEGFFLARVRRVASCSEPE